MATSMKRLPAPPAATLLTMCVVAAVVLPAAGRAHGLQIQFDKYDTDGNDLIDFDEFKVFLLAKTGQDLPDTVVQYSFNVADQNGDGNLNLHEFGIMMGEAVDEPETPDDAAGLQMEFDMSDTDTDGNDLFDFGEFKAFLLATTGQDMPDSVVQYIFDEADQNGDGVLTADEVEQLAAY